uniref:FinTRIM family, member 82 n=1 Tax=Paramormyrops kingsleyae TaxID=1676925 RepID=A0A3B3TGF3_9TELE
MADPLSPDHFSCPLCVGILKDPVAIPCGHSYCMDCISSYWDEADYTGIYVCPQCRITFTQRPVLRPNTMLTKVAERLKKGSSPPVGTNSYAGPGDVPCDFCIGKKFKAVKSCLNCLASYCEKHLKPHYESTTFKRHKLVDELGNLDRKICPQHQKSLELFCRTDQMCICALCTVSEHRGHDIVSAEAERSEKQKLLGASQAEIRQKCQGRMKELEELRTAVDSLKSSAERAMAESEKMFREMISSIERMRSEVTKLIGINEKAAFNQADGLVERLEQEIEELKKKELGLKQLYSTEDHIHFLQNFNYLCTPTDDGVIPKVTVNPDFSFSMARKAVAEIKERLEELGREELLKISRSVNEIPVYTMENRSKEKPIKVASQVTVDSAPPPEPRNRSDFLKYFCQLRLDPNTAYKELYLTEGNRKVIRTRDLQPYPESSERFDCFAQGGQHHQRPALSQDWDLPGPRRWHSLLLQHRRDHEPPTQVRDHVYRARLPWVWSGNLCQNMSAQMTEIRAETALKSKSLVPSHLFLVLFFIVRLFLFICQDPSVKQFKLSLVRFFLMRNCLRA